MRGSRPAVCAVTVAMARERPKRVEKYMFCAKSERQIFGCVEAKKPQSAKLLEAIERARNLISRANVQIYEGIGGCFVRK